MKFDNSTIVTIITVSSLIGTIATAIIREWYRIRMRVRETELNIEQLKKDAETNKDESVAIINEFKQILTEAKEMTEEVRKEIHGMKIQLGFLFDKKQ